MQLNRFISAICCLCIINCVQVKVADSNRVILKCTNSNRTITDDQVHCSLKSTRCLLSGYKIDKRDEIYHPKEAYYVSCVIFDQTKVNVSKSTNERQI